MSDINEGDQVSWKYGGGNPEGTVAEVKASNELAIETKGRQVKVNASEDNPVVHVARDGNDVVKRESALTKKADATENGSSEAKLDPDIKQNGQHPHNEREANKEESAPTASDNNAISSVTDEPEQLEQLEQLDDKMDVIPDTKKVEVGEKRSREDDDSGETQNGEEQSQKENRNASKKTKLVNGDAAENAHPHHAENRHAHNNENGVDTSVAEEETPKKAKCPGRPKKVDVEAKHAVAVEGDGSTIARRTRSKA